MFFQSSLPDVGEVASVGDVSAGLERRELAGGAWVDLRPRWLSGADELFLALQERVPWQAQEREMYESTVAVPRLLCHYGAKDAWPDPVLDDAREALSAHYAAELGERFATAGLCLYRDGRDSVAWHGDRIGRGRSQDTMVAIISLGASRRLSLRPAPGGPAAGEPGFTLPVGHGDLLVMGGSCQRTWEHAVLKTARPVGPRISIQLRPAGVL